MKWCLVMKWNKKYYIGAGGHGGEHRSFLLSQDITQEEWCIWGSNDTNSSFSSLGNEGVTQRIRKERWEYMNLISQLLIFPLRWCPEKCCFSLPSNCITNLPKLEMDLAKRIGLYSTDRDECLKGKCYFEVIL